MMHGHEKSDPEVVAIRTNAYGVRREKPANNAAPTAAEAVERTLRSGTLACANRTLGRAGTRQFDPEQAVETLTASQETIRLQRVVSEDGEEVRLHCHSAGRGVHDHQRTGRGGETVEHIL
jgi:hypothetical protein